MDVADPSQPNDEQANTPQGRLRALLYELRDAACVACRGEGSTVTRLSGYQVCAQCGGSGYHTPRG
jgi:DnaJ-class molecular chaperone